MTRVRGCTITKEINADNQRKSDIVHRLTFLEKRVKNYTGRGLNYCMHICSGLRTTTHLQSDRSAPWHNLFKNISREVIRNVCRKNSLHTALYTRTVYTRIDYNIIIERKPFYRVFYNSVFFLFKIYLF